MKTTKLNNAKSFVLLILTICLYTVGVAQDNVAPSQDPPGGLQSYEVPQFIVFGWDDNSLSGLDGSGGDGAIKWILDYFSSMTNPVGSGNDSTFDGTGINCSFYVTSGFADTIPVENAVLVKKVWREAYEGGFEIANHTYSHPHGGVFSSTEWESQIQGCTNVLTRDYDSTEVSFDPTTGIGLNMNDMYGFRTPFLEYSVPLFETLLNNNYVYDCSIEEGYQSAHNGTNYNWPYTLDNGSPGHDVLVGWGLRDSLGSVPGLWEIPAYPYLVPANNVISNYGLTESLRTKCKAINDDFDVSGGKITGFDYNLMDSYEMTKEEYLAVLKYTLDLRLSGNRAPLTLGVHSDYYSPKYNSPKNITFEDRKAVIEEFIQYAQTKQEVRIVSAIDVINWMRNPVKLGVADAGPFTLSLSPESGGSIVASPDSATYAFGTSVTLTATGDDGYVFTGWGGDVMGASNPITIVMTGDKSVTASFKVNSCTDSTNLARYGSWSTEKDNIGSTVVLSDGDDNSKIMDFTMAQRISAWPWLGIGGVASVSDFIGICGVSITYKSDESFVLSFPQAPLSNFGESYQTILAPSAEWKTVSTPLAQFAQPDWAAEHPNTPLDLSIVTSIALAPDIDPVDSAITGRFEFKRLMLYGIEGPDASVSNRIMESGFSIYPTPADEYIQLFMTNVDADAELSIISVNGQVALNKQIHDELELIDVSSLQAGIYIARVLSNGTYSYQKIIIK